MMTAMIIMMMAIDLLRLANLVRMHEKLVRLNEAVVHMLAAPRI